jgi:minor histocompatibility antigen H13
MELGSVALFGLYITVKYFGTEWINYLLGWYMSIAGIGSVWQVGIRTSAIRTYTGILRNDNSAPSPLQSI